MCPFSKSKLLFCIMTFSLRICTFCIKKTKSTFRTIEIYHINIILINNGLYAKWLIWSCDFGVNLERFCEIQLCLK